MFPRLPGLDAHPGLNGAPGFPMPFLFRFPPPFGLPPGNMPPTMMPQLPAAFQMFLEARMKQLEAAAAGVVETSPTPGSHGTGQRPASGISKVGGNDQRKLRCLQRPTKQIQLQVLNGDDLGKQIVTTLRHTEDPTGLEKLLENGEKCENLTIVCVSAADSTSHCIVYTGNENLTEGSVLEVPLSWQNLCNSTTFEHDANISDANIVLHDLKYGDEIVFLKPSTTALKREISLHQPVQDGLNRDSMSRGSSIPTPQASESTNATLASLFPELCGLASPSSPEAPPTMVKAEESVVPEISSVNPGPLAPAGGYQCERCGKMFSYAYYRDKHLKYTRCVDNGDRRFPCPLCTRSFEKRDRLRIHILHVHENHRPHVCDVCGKSFSQSSSLNKHRRVHSGERPYKCPFCSKCFTASSILRTHIRQHSGEKPFKCAFCGKSFASHAAHDSHVRRTHSDQNTANLLKCNVCDKCFDHESHLQFHIQCFHPSE